MLKTISISLLLLAMLSGCGARPQPAAEEVPELQSDTIFAMDTVIDLRIYGDKSVLQDVETRIGQLESLLSVTDEDSEVYRLNHTGACTLSEDSGRVLERALSLCQRTDGALDISIYPVLCAWGFTTDNYAVPKESALQELLELVDYRRIQYDAATRVAQLPTGMEIDLGSIGKGYTSSQIAALLRQSGVSSALVNLGGNVQAVGTKPDGEPWRIAIRDPEGEDPLGVLELADKAVVTSGGYERFFEQDGNVYWHILDPATGQSAHSGLLSVTVIGEDGALCDGLSTALFVMGQEAGTALWRQSDDFDAIFVAEDGTVAITEGLEDCFFLEDTTAQRVCTVLRRN